MSGDETDGDTKEHPAVFRIIITRWQSIELRNFLFLLDQIYRSDWKQPHNRRATPGNQPRVRLIRQDATVEDGVAPIGLWRNCYDQHWLQAQPPHMQRELEIVEEPYDFN